MDLSWGQPGLYVKIHASQSYIRRPRSKKGGWGGVLGVTQTVCIHPVRSQFWRGSPGEESLGSSWGS